MMSFLRNYFLGLFFVPHNIAEDDPSQYGLNTDHVQFESLDGRTLHGYFLKSKGRAKGTILHCHGNTGNITSHFSLMTFLVAADYNVFVFDYGGYGASQGKPSPQSIIDDTRAALHYLRTRTDVDSRRIILFGQSLGGAAASGAMVKDKDVAGLVLEGTFTTYREMAFATWIGKALFFLTPFVIPNEGPLWDLPRINSRPVLIVHGDQDATIPVQFGQDLYKTAVGKKSMAILKSFGHLDGAEAGGSYRDIILGFLERTLSAPPSN